MCFVVTVVLGVCLLVVCVCVVCSVVLYRLRCCYGVVCIAGLLVSVQCLLLGVEM
jgi:hypothetical protein